MPNMSTTLLVFYIMFSVALASPTFQDATTASPVSVVGFAPYTQFARAAYCPSWKLSGWKCGGALPCVMFNRKLCLDDYSEACRALSSFKLTLLGGDGNIVQTCRSLQFTRDQKRRLHLM